MHMYIHTFHMYIHTYVRTYRQTDIMPVDIHTRTIRLKQVLCRHMGLRKASEELAVVLLMQAYDNVPQNALPYVTSMYSIHREC